MSKRLVYITKENQINKTLRKFRKDGTGTIYVLFTSLWDEWCVKLIDELTQAYGDTSNQEDTPIYILNSLDTPHSFKIFKTNKVPHLVQINEDGLYSEDYLPKIYETLLSPELAECSSQS